MLCHLRFFLFFLIRVLWCRNPEHHGFFNRFLQVSLFEPFAFEHLGSKSIINLSFYIYIQFPHLDTIDSYICRYVFIKIALSEDLFTIRKRAVGRTAAFFHLSISYNPILGNRNIKNEPNRKRNPFLPLLGLPISNLHGCESFVFCVCCKAFKQVWKAKGKFCF